MGRERRALFAAVVVVVFVSLVVTVASQDSFPGDQHKPCNGSFAAPPMAVTITEPAAGQNYSGRITVMATVAGANVSAVTLTFDGSLISTLSAPPYTWRINTADYPNGAANITVTARDAQGHIAFSSISIRVDNPNEEEIIGQMIGTVIGGSLMISAGMGTVLILFAFHRERRGGGKS